MPGSSNTSFIPKRNPIKDKRRNAPRPVFIGTLIIRIFFFAILLSAVGVYAYERSLNNEYNAEVKALNDAIASFNDESMQQVLDIDNRLYQAQTRISNTASIATIFSALEAATLKSVRIQSLNLKRVDDKHITIESHMETDSFDSVLFQRHVLENDDKLVISKIEDLGIVNNTNGESGSSKKNTPLNVAFIADVEVDTSLVPHQPLSSRLNIPTVGTSSLPADTGTSSIPTTQGADSSEEVEVTNQESI
ncbi:MAG: hypothetical protein H6779_04010 [Candidatus Nomurabacteria bacterium]|nr:MAG: hypothetical protein H6779_04010 [Candidatus Nomurabacteria bacterium]